MLTNELIRLPERVDGFMAEQRQFAERTDQRLETIDGRLERMDDRLDRMEQDAARSNNRYSEAQARAQASTIALALDFDLVRIVPNEELARMCGCRPQRTCQTVTW